MKKADCIICDDLVGAKEIERLFGLRPRSGYTLIKKINTDLQERGKLILPGYLPRDIFANYLKSKNREG